MYSVTRRIRSIKQPEGGYVNISKFSIEKIEDDFLLNENENINPGVVGMAVDYLTRFVMGERVEKAFQISFRGAMIAEGIFRQKDSLKHATNFLKHIKGLDDISIINACKIVTFDVWLRNPISAMKSKGADDTNPNLDTIENIRIMVKRCVDFLKIQGPIIKSNLTFGPNGYTKVVSSGDGDYLTDDTIWDFKVSKNKPNSQHTLQLLMYWIMGQHSGQEIYKKISKIGIYNPRLNTIYLLSIEKIPQEVIKEIEDDVICYEH